MLKPILSKSLIAVIAVGSLFIYSSCSDDVKDNPENGDMVIDDDYYEFQAFDLEKYDIPAFINLPDETANIGASTKPEVIHTEDDIYWQINVGQSFTLCIEDYGSITDLVKVEKEELAKHKFFKVKYLVDEPDLIIYERTLVPKGTENASSRVGVEHKSYHVYGQKTIGSITYALESREEGFNKMIIELMAKSIRSFKEKE